MTQSNGKPAKDWNELFTLKHNGNIESFHRECQQLLDQAQTTIEYKITHIPKDTQKRDIAGLLQPIITDIAQLPEIEQAFYIDVIIDHFKGTVTFKREDIRREIKQARKRITRNREEKVEILNDRLIRISPALDFVGGIGYLTVPLEVLADGEISRRYYLITSDREQIPLSNTDFFQHSNIILKSEPNVLDESRWSSQDIRKFIQDDSQVDPVVIFIDIRETYKEYLDFRESHTAETIALWTMGTYIFPIFESYPYLFLCGEKGSGKTKTMNVAEKLCFNAIHSSSISPALLFRIIEGSSCTLLIDEAEALQYRKQSDDLRQLLNGGYKRGGGAYRCEPNSLQPQRFGIYSPKMIANIGGLESVLETRCIRITMLRTKDKSKSDKAVIERGVDWGYLRNRLYCFGLTCFPEIREIYLKEAPRWNLNAVSGREGELWFPLLSIAMCLDRKGYDGLYDRIKEVAMMKSQEARDTGLDDWSNALLLALKVITLSQETDIQNRDIRERMKEYFDDDSAALTGRWIGNALTRFKLVAERKRTNRGYCYTIKRKTVEDVIERYGV